MERALERGALDWDTGRWISIPRATPAARTIGFWSSDTERDRAAQAVAVLEHLQTLGRLDHLTRGRRALALTRDGKIQTKAAV